MKPEKLFSFIIFGILGAKPHCAANKIHKSMRRARQPEENIINRDSIQSDSVRLDARERKKFKEIAGWLAGESA
jgi:hypothetical protein